MTDSEVMTTYPAGTRVCRIEDEKDTGTIVAYERDDHGLLVIVRWHIGYQTWVRPDRVRPIA